jgi:hypothetical protein
MTKNSFNNETSLAKNVGNARALEIIEKRTANDIP